MPRTMQTLLLATFALALLSPLAAHAADQGEIAVVEDDGSVAQVVALPDFFLAAASKIFYKTHTDLYDDLFVFYNGAGAGVQQGWTVYSSVKGIGRDYTWDQRTRFGVPGGKLNMTVKMGSLSTLPESPDDRAVIVPGYPLTGAELMGHEFGHRWLAAITYKQGGTTHCWVRGMESTGQGTGDACDGYTTDEFNQHWSAYFNSRSVMYGGFYEDLGGGQFRLTYPAAGYSDLDQYLMGLRPRAGIDNSQLFIVDNGDPVTGSSAIAPAHGTDKTVSGTKISFTMDDVIASVGERIPAQDPCHRKAAFVLVLPKGTTATAAQVAKMDKWRKRWETYYDWATGNRGSVDTTLAATGPGTATCPSGSPPDGGFPDSGSTSDAGYVACTGGVTSGDLRGMACAQSGDTCDAADSTCGPGGYVPCHCQGNFWICPAVDCIDGGVVIEDTGTPDDGGVGDGGQAVACGQYSSTSGYVGRPCAVGGETCQVDSNACGATSKVPCHCDEGVWTCPAIDCADGGGTTTDTGATADGADPLDDGGATGGSDAGGKSPDTGVADGGEPSGCSCATLGL